MYDGIKNRRDACSAVGIVGARTTHAIPTMLALRRGARRVVPVLSQRETLNLRTGRRDDVAVVPANAKSIANKPIWRNPAFAQSERVLPRIPFQPPLVAIPNLRSSCRVRSFRA
jgi:hypothetical protein